MRVKRTCRRCGYVWYGSLAGGVAGLAVRSAFAVFFSSMISRGRDTYIDVAKAHSELSPCPNCGTKDDYNTVIERDEETPVQKPAETKDRPMTPGEKKVAFGCLITFVVVIIITIITAIVCTHIVTKREDNAAFEKAISFLQNSEYEQAWQELNKISEGYEKYSTVQAWKKELEPKVDSLLAAAEYTKTLEAISVLKNYINSKESGTASKEFQSVIKSEKDRIVVSNRLFMVLIEFGEIAETINLCEKFQQSEMKYLKPQERDNLKAELKKIITPARNKLKKEQIRDFPILRKEMAKIIQKMSQEHWKHTIKVQAKGNGNTRLEYISSVFADESNIDIYQKEVLIKSNAIKNFIKPYRFKRITYKGYENDGEYSYYEYNTPEDDVELDENSFPAEDKK
jgi:hypothetical protein